MSRLGKVLLVLVFLASLGFLYVAARALKTHAEFRKHHEEHAEALKDRDKRLALLDGITKDENPQDTSIAEGLKQVTQKLELLTASQGRLWRDCTLAGRNGNVLTLQVPNPNHGMTDKNVLYVFEQHQHPATYDDGIYSNNRPAVFLGEFKITQVAGAAVSVQPTRALTPSQKQALDNSQGPFACYEQLLVDQHATWAELKKHLAERNRIEALTRWFDTALVDAATLKEFQRDGGPAADDDLAERILVEVKFLKDYADLDQAQQTELRNMNFNIINLRTPAGDDAKDPEGKVISVDVTKLVQKDAIAYLMLGLPSGDPGPAQKLIDMNIAQEQRRLFVRQLRDYGLILRQVLAELPVMANRLQDLLTNITTKNDEKTKLDGDIKIEQVLQDLLKIENKTLKDERAAVAAARAEVAADLAEILKQNAELEVAIRKWMVMLKQKQLEEADRINRAAREKISKRNDEGRSTNDERSPKDQ